MPEDPNLIQTIRRRATANINDQIANLSFSPQACQKQAKAGRCVNTGPYDSPQNCCQGFPS
jgi:hypothetical protein